MSTQSTTPVSEGCSWLVRVASGNPEPDSIEDTYRDVECGASVLVNPFGSYACSNGHRHVSFADPNRGAFELELLAEERAAEGERF